jgi:hypothetical protein
MDISISNKEYQELVPVVAYWQSKKALLKKTLSYFKLARYKPNN